MGIGIGHPGEAAPDVACASRSCKLDSCCLDGTPTNSEDGHPLLARDAFRPTPLVPDRERGEREGSARAVRTHVTMGKVNQNVAPFPGELSTPQAPLCCSMSVWQI